MRQPHRHAKIPGRGLQGWLDWGRLTVAWSLVAAVCLCASVASADIYKLDLNSPLGRRLSNIPENGWVQVNLNEFQDVWTPLDQRPKPPEAPSVGGPWSIIKAWSSMAWDGNRGTLIFYGGGHANYPGNEVYRWIASTMQWERASLPSEVYLATGTVLFYAVDGPFNAPAAAHTYDSTEFLPLADRYISFGGASFNTGHYYDLIDGTRTGPYVWDPSRAFPDAVGGTAGSQVKPQTYPSVIGGHMWQNRNNLQPPPGQLRPGYSGTYMINGTSAYAQENGKDVLYLQDGAELFRYVLNDVNDPTKDTYQRVGRYISRPFSGQGAGAYDPVRKIFLRSANSTITYWTLTAPGDSNENFFVTPVVTSGTFDFANLQQYGLDFDPIRRVFVLWKGLREVWALRAPTDLATGVWTLEPLSPVSPEFPNLTAANTGIIGKWKYAASLDVFLGAFDPYKGQVWAYKPTNWRPSVVAPLPFIVAPAASSVYAAGSNIPIVADSIDNTVSNITVYANGTLIGTGSTVPFSFTWLNVPAGAYSLTARATGADGIQRQSTAVAISVNTGGNTPPTVQLTSPAQGASYVAGSNIGFAANASDAGGSVAKVEFFANGAKVGEDLTSPYAFTWVNPAAGTHVLTAVATDNLGAQATSASVTVSVTASTSNIPPTVSLTAPAAGSSFLTGASIAFAASANDSDGSVAKVEFYANGGKVGEDLASPYALAWTVSAAGSYSLTAVAVDNLGARTTSSPAVSVSVTDPVTGGQTITLQDGVAGYAGTRDTYLYEYHNTVNFGAQTYLQDKASVSRFRTMVRFAIFQSEGGPVPNGATINSARLSLYKFSSYDYLYRLRPLLVDWVEGEATWQQRSAGVPWNAAGALGAGTDLAASYDAQASTAFSPGWIDFDVTTGVRAIGGGRANFGWLLDPVSGNGNLKQFDSSEYATASFRPKLVVTYSGAGTTNVPPTASLTAPSPGADFVSGANVAITANANDADGTVAKVEFFANGNKVGEDLTSPYAFTWVAPPVGTYALTAVATDNVGARTTSSPAVSINVSSSTGNTLTVTLQDGLGGYTGNRDTYLYEFHNTLNFGTATFLDDKPTISRFRTLVRFAIFQSEGGPVPDGATVTSARLSLYKFSSYDYVYRVRPLLANWVETEATWQVSRLGVAWASAGATGIGTDLATTFDAQAATPFAPGWVDFDVTNGVNAIVAGRANYGWLLEPVSGNGNLKEFRSSEYTGDLTLRPKLVITYQN